MHVGVMLLVGLGYQGRRQLLVVGGKHSDGAREGASVLQREKSWMLKIEMVLHYDALLCTAFKLKHTCYCLYIGSTSTCESALDLEISCQI